MEFLGKTIAWMLITFIAIPVAGIASYGIYREATDNWFYTPPQQVSYGEPMTDEEVIDRLKELGVKFD